MLPDFREREDGGLILFSLSVSCEAAARAAAPDFFDRVEPGLESPSFSASRSRANVDDPAFRDSDGRLGASSFADVTRASPVFLDNEDAGVAFASATFCGYWNEAKVMVPVLRDGDGGGLSKSTSSSSGKDCDARADDAVLGGGEEGGEISTSSCRPCRDGNFDDPGFVHGEEGGDSNSTSASSQDANVVPPFRLDIDPNAGITTACFCASWNAANDIVPDLPFDRGTYGASSSAMLRYARAAAAPDLLDTDEVDGAGGRLFTFFSVSRQNSREAGGCAFLRVFSDDDDATGCTSPSLSGSCEDDTWLDSLLLDESGGTRPVEILVLLLLRVFSTLSRNSSVATPVFLVNDDCDEGTTLLSLSVDFDCFTRRAIEDGGRGGGFVDIGDGEMGRGTRVGMCKARRHRARRCTTWAPNNA